MKIVLLVVFFFVCTSSCFSQLKPNSNRLESDSAKIQQPGNDTIVVDSSANRITYGNNSIGNDNIVIDSNRINAFPQLKSYQLILNELLKKNQLLNVTEKPIALKSVRKYHHGKEHLFYLLAGIILTFGFFKIFYAAYFNNIFRVFFNTSLRQNQLTDLLLQAKLPSLIFNIFFLVTGGLYLWLLLNNYRFINEENNRRALAFCVVTISLIYIIKFCVLKFIGWVTGMVTPVDTYIFVIFLVNKITGVVLLPFVVLLAFAAQAWQSSVVILSYLIIGILFLLRFIRSYGLLQHQLNISRMHFLLYIVSVEVLPLLVVYKLFFKLV